MMIQAGNNITALGDKLEKVNIEYLFHSIRHPKLEIHNKINQLRIVRSLDPKQYGQLKKQLPYFVCGVFNPNIRRTENFAYISFFVIDIDHISEKGMSLEDLRKKVESDSRVLLSFISPGEDGLKLMFRLNERCYDAGVFSVFYKVFLSLFSQQYGLEQVADARTSDVTRACFISFDPQVYYNPQADSVNLNAIVDADNSYSLFQEKKKVEKVNSENSGGDESKKEEKREVDSDIILQIKTILGNAPKPKDKPAAYVPEQLNDIMDELASFITQTGMVIKEVINISYGKKIKTVVGVKEAEVNLFHGKKGFSVVQSPKTGTTPEMNQMLADLIQVFLQMH